MTEQTVSQIITVTGVVQGVGFRPFVYRLARDHGLTGWVLNHSGGVDIEVEGAPEVLAAFRRALRAQAPPLARIERITAQDIAPNGHATFEIRHSVTQEGRYQLISPDIATCADCRRELLDPADRRYRYPFTNCTNCGPRFTIIADIPYDRPKTTMRVFAMCPACQREYDDPLDRRFHAQPNACPVCGPHVWLEPASPVQGLDQIEAAARLLQAGAILAIKGLGGFHLACDATNAAAVQMLRARKQRPHKPLAVMLATLDEVKKHCHVSAAEEALLTSPQCPIVLLAQRPESTIVPQVAPGNRTLGVMLPYTPLHHVLLRDVGRPLVMTSGNLSEEPIAQDNDEAQQRLGGLCDYFLFHNRDIYARYDDSVWHVLDLGDGQALPHAHQANAAKRRKRRSSSARRARIKTQKLRHARVSGHPGLYLRMSPPLWGWIPAFAGMTCHARESGHSPASPTFAGAGVGAVAGLSLIRMGDGQALPQPLRRARGYAPFPITLPFSVPPILATGAELKNTFCLARAEYAFLSQHIGDMENLETLEHWEATLALYRHLFRLSPEVVAHDLHPDYLTTRFARRSALRAIPIQHHHAHIAACLADNGWGWDAGPVIGVALDGTGYGEDGAIWGGEWLVGDYKGFRRAAQLEYLPLPGGEAAIRQPWRIAAAYVYALLGAQAAPPALLPQAQAALFYRQIERRINTPLTSSLGRLFDAVSALLGVCRQATYEAQAAIELEQIALPAGRDGLSSYPFGLEKVGQVWQIRLAGLFEALLGELERGAPLPLVSLRFHSTVAQMVMDTCRRIGDETGVRTAALSGGCFQNRLLTRLTVSRLREAGLQVLLHRHAPCNDGGVSLGQAALAQAQMA